MSHFYTDPVVIADFRAYVAHLLNHVSSVTGVRLGDDPTVAIWETGNELWDAPPEWTQQTAAYIKTLAPHALVADGSAATGMHVAEAAVNEPSVDVVGGHFYPTDAAWAHTDAQVAAAHGKAYVVGEFPLTGPNLAGWLTGLAQDPNVAGDLAWTLLPYLDDGTPEQHGEGQRTCPARPQAGAHRATPAGCTPVGVLGQSGNQAVHASATTSPLWRRGIWSSRRPTLRRPPWCRLS